MGKGVLIRPSKVRPLYRGEKYISRMLLDHTNSGTDKIHINHGIVPKGVSLYPASAHGTENDAFDEIYVILKGKCKLYIDGDILDLEPSDVVYIPSGVLHALDNTEGTEDTEILTVWAGVPPKGINDNYDLRLEQWGKTYMTVDEVEGK